MHVSGMVSSDWRETIDITEHQVGRPGQPGMRTAGDPRQGQQQRGTHQKEEEKEKEEGQGPLGCRSWDPEKRHGIKTKGEPPPQSLSPNPQPNLFKPLTRDPLPASHRADWGILASSCPESRQQTPQKECQWHVSGDILSLLQTYRAALILLLSWYP